MEHNYNNNDNKFTINAKKDLYAKKVYYITQTLNKRKCNNYLYA